MFSGGENCNVGYLLGNIMYQSYVHSLESFVSLHVSDPPKPNALSVLLVWALNAIALYIR